MVVAAVDWLTECRDVSTLHNVPVIRYWAEQQQQQWLRAWSRQRRLTFALAQKLRV